MESTSLPLARPAGRDPERERLVRRARVLAWLGISWHGIEATIAIAAGLIGYQGRGPPEHGLRLPVRCPVDWLERECARRMVVGRSHDGARNRRRRGPRRWRGLAWRILLRRAGRRRRRHRRLLQVGP